eukprot:12352427-Ditylum_brightwellii.AAC.1
MHQQQSGSKQSLLLEDIPLESWWVVEYQEEGGIEVISVQWGEIAWSRGVVICNALGQLFRDAVEVVGMA